MLKKIKLAVVTFVCGVLFAVLGGWQIERFQATRSLMVSSPQSEQHMLYALQWFALAIVLMVAFLIYSSRSRAKG